MAITEARPQTMPNMERHAATTVEPGGDARAFHRAAAVASVVGLLVTLAVLRGRSGTPAATDRVAASGAAAVTAPVEGRRVALPASVVDQDLDAAERRLAAATPASYVALAGVCMRKAGQTGDPSWYGRAGTAVERALALDPESYEALRMRAWILLGKHEFAAALAAAEEARRRDPDDWWNDATLCDARVELGDYDAAVEAAERMVDRHPGLPSYTRLAYLRSLLGDRPGAVALLTLAARSGSARDPDALAWTLVHLGHELFNGGDVGAARAAYERALRVVPDQPLALAGLARARAAEGGTADAIARYTEAIARTPTLDLVAALGDVYTLAGESALAERQYQVADYMARVAETSGWLDRRQLALYLANHDREPRRALELARQEAASRRDIYTEDALAWALYKSGRAREALRPSRRSLRLGTDDAMLHYHAGMIAAALGRSRRARSELRRALDVNPHFDPLQAGRARAALAALGEET